MGKKVLVDTDILIKTYRGDKQKYQQLQLIESDFSISVITACEILNGAKTHHQLNSSKREMKAYNIIHLNNEISIKAFQLFSAYAVKNQMRVADLLIAATALHQNLELYTDNKRHFSFIKGLRLYEEKQ